MRLELEIWGSAIVIALAAVGFGAIVLAIFDAVTSEQIWKFTIPAFVGVTAGVIFEKIMSRRRKR